MLMFSSTFPSRQLFRPTPAVPTSTLQFVDASEHREGNKDVRTPMEPLFHSTSRSIPRIFSPSIAPAASSGYNPLSSPFSRLREAPHTGSGIWTATLQPMAKRRLVEYVRSITQGVGVGSARIVEELLGSQGRIQEQEGEWAAGDGSSSEDEDGDGDGEASSSTGGDAASTETNATTTTGGGRDAPGSKGKKKKNNKKKSNGKGAGSSKRDDGKADMNVNFNVPLTGPGPPPRGRVFFNGRPAGQQQQQQGWMHPPGGGYGFGHPMQAMMNGRVAPHLLFGYGVNNNNRNGRHAGRNAGGRGGGGGRGNPRGPKVGVVPQQQQQPQRPAPVLESAYSGIIPPPQSQPPAGPRGGVRGKSVSGTASANASGNVSSGTASPAAFPELVVINDDDDDDEGGANNNLVDTLRLPKRPQGLNECDQGEPTPGTPPVKTRAIGYGLGGEHLIRSQPGRVRALLLWTPHTLEAQFGSQQRRREWSAEELMEYVKERAREVEGDVAVEDQPQREHEHEQKMVSVDADDAQAVAHVAVAAQSLQLIIYQPISLVELILQTILGAAR